MARDVYQLVAVGQAGGEFWEFVQHFESGVTSSSDPATDAQHCINQWIDNIEALWQPCLPTSVLISGYKCKRVNNGGGPTWMEPVTPVQGTRTGTLALGALGPCVISQYNNGTRWTAGKLFMPGIIQADISSGHLATGLITAVQAFIAELTTTHTEGTTWDFVVWSKKLTTAFLPFSVDISLKVGVQKRRLLPVM